MIATDELVDWYLLQHRDWRQRDQGHTRTGWRASSLGYCPRKQTFARHGIPSYREFDAQTLRTFSYGDMTHDWIKKIYRNTGVLLAEEDRLEDPSRDVAGHFDVLLGGEPVEITDIQRERWSPVWTAHVEEMRKALTEHLKGFEDELILGEIKSMNSRALSYARKDGPRDGHVEQLGAYISMLRADPSQVLSGMPVTDGRLIYIGKDSVGILEFALEEEWVDRADAALDLLNGHWKADSLPPCTCAGWQVGYCDYLKPEARTFGGKPKSGVQGGIDCCPSELFDKRPAREEEEGK